MKSSLASLKASTPTQARLSPDEATPLLERLVSARWCRLSSEYDDPLGMLFNNRVRHWTAGWDPQGGALFLLLWETDSWDEKGVWRLYENGQLLFEEADGASKTRHALCSKLLEDEKLPFITSEQFLNPLVHYQVPVEHRNMCAQALLDMILARPEIFLTLQEGLFKALEADLASEEWPLLEVLKVHRLSHKNLLVWLFKQFVQRGLLRTLKDNTRLDRALFLLQEDYFQFGYQVSPIFRRSYHQAYDDFRHMITDGNWRVSLRFKAPRP